jgi:hypothetical protein
MRAKNRDIAALEARVSQNSTIFDRPSFSDPPFVKQPSPSTTKGTPGAKPEHPGHPRGGARVLHVRLEAVHQPGRNSTGPLLSCIAEKLI